MSRRTVLGVLWDRQKALNAERRDTFVRGEGASFTSTGVVYEGSRAPAW